jgi:hypothetical protein
VFELIGNPSINGSSLLLFGTSFADQKLITVSTLLGQVILDERISRSTTHYTYHTSELAPGVYLVSVTDGEQYYTRKLMK